MTVVEPRRNMRERVEREIRSGGYEVGEEALAVDVYASCPVSDELETVTVVIQPTAPRCIVDGEVNASGHDWEQPQEVVGGCDENPGFFGNGAGIVARYVCACCGTYKRLETGSQGGDEEYISYQEADDKSLAWVESLGVDDDEEDDIEYAGTAR